MTATLQVVITAMASGVLYSLYWYVNKYFDPTSTTGEEGFLCGIDLYSLAATCLIGGGLGIATAIYGLPELTQANIGAQLVLYAGLTAVVGRGIKTFLRALVKKFPWLVQQ